MLKLFELQSPRARGDDERPETSAELGACSRRQPHRFPRAKSAHDPAKPAGAGNLVVLAAFEPVRKEVQLERKTTRRRHPCPGREQFEDLRRAKSRLKWRTYLILNPESVFSRWAIWHPPQFRPTALASAAALSKSPAAASLPTISNPLWAFFAKVTASGALCASQ